jgi:hypothetical protein
MAKDGNSTSVFFFYPKLTSNHVILQVSVYMRDTCPHGTPHHWCGYRIFYLIFFNDFLKKNLRMGQGHVWGWLTPKSQSEEKKIKLGFGVLFPFGFIWKELNQINIPLIP